LAWQAFIARHRFHHHPYQIALAASSASSQKVRSGFGRRSFSPTERMPASIAYWSDDHANISATDGARLWFRRILGATLIQSHGDNADRAHRKMLS